MATLGLFDNLDIFYLVVQQSGLDCDWDITTTPRPDLRSSLRLVSTSTCSFLDGMVSCYRDCRRSHEATLHVLPRAIAEQAAVAMKRFGPLRQLQLEGLNDEGLDAVLATAAQTASRLEVLSLQRGVFSGTGMYTSSAILPDWTHTPSLPRLLELELGGCGFLTDAGLEALLGATPLLARLRITVNALLRRPRLSCPGLVHATLAICANLADDAVDDLCAGAPLLRE